MITKELKSKMYDALESAGVLVDGCAICYSISITTKQEGEGFTTKFEFCGKDGSPLISKQRKWLRAEDTLTINMWHPFKMPISITNEEVQ